MSITPRLLAIHAHPDDECISTGGVLADTVARGYHAKVLTCTDGRRGEIVDPTMDAQAVAPILHEVRERELANAMEILGGVDYELLGYHDSGMVGDDGNNDPDTFWQANVDEAVRRVVAVIRDYQPAVVILYDPWGGYGHPDHIQAHRVGTLAVEAAAVSALYPEAGPAWNVPKTYQTAFTKRRVADLNAQLIARGLSTPFGEETNPDNIVSGVYDHQVTTRIDVRNYLKTKLAALKAHKTQVHDTSHFFNFPPDLEEMFYGYETFRLVRANHFPTTEESDIFEQLDTY
ncbi:PIG-L family deacetylase [Stomatohabitans albus]|uniref:PIG-L family deacetylase n=1 Tax=Stomatohabitans albus TaxID=3110766 RepID=UPI00300C9899